MQLQAVLNIEQLRYLAQDETRMGRKSETTRVVSAKGVKPSVKVAWPREAFWRYGVVEPLSGWQWTQESATQGWRKLPAVYQRPLFAVRRNSGGDADGQSACSSCGQAGVVGEYHPNFSAGSLPEAQPD